MPNTKRSTTFSKSDPTSSIDRVTEYARQAVAGEIVVGKQVRLACERHLNDLKVAAARGLFWKPDIARYRLEFYPKYLRHSKGKWAKQPMHLSDWQAFVIGSIHGWRKADGSRRFNTAYVEIGRKNGKSTMAAGVGLDLFIVDQEPGAEIYSAATKRDQARIIFDEAKRMVRMAPQLASKIEQFKGNLSIDATSSKFEPLSSDTRTLDGLNPHAVLVDELHKHKDRTLLDVFDTALGARRQPLILIITTAGDDAPETVYANENTYALQVLSGVIEDDSFFAYIAALDKDDKWDDPAVWIKANPNMDISVSMDDLSRQARKAAKSPSARSAFKRLRLNLRQAGAERAIEMELWAENTEHEQRYGKLPYQTWVEDNLMHRRCWCGLDLSSKIDVSAFVKLFEPLEPGGRMPIVCRFWMPRETLEERSDRDSAPFLRWAEEGWIELTDGNVIDHNVIEEAVLEDSKHFKIESCAYDPWNATQLTSSLFGKGVEVIEFVQGSKSYAEPTNDFEAQLTARRYEHGDNPVLRWMASNLMFSRDKNENKMPNKLRSTGRIDGMTSLIMATGRKLLAPPPSIYDSAELFGGAKK